MPQNEYLWSKSVNFASIEYQVLITYILLSLFTFLRITPVHAANICIGQCDANLTFASGNGTRGLKPIPNKPWFLRVCSSSLLKTLWEKKKIPEMELGAFNLSQTSPGFYFFCSSSLLWE